MRITNLLAALCIASTAMAAHALPADQIYKRLAPSIWLVSTTDENAKLLATGSAVVIGPETMVTNCHVLSHAARVQVRHENTLHNASLEFPDPEHDLCQLHVPGLAAPAVPITVSTPVVGQRVYAIGAPRAYDATLSDGLVSGLRSDDKGVLKYIQTSAPISPGSSGGGLFDEEGYLIGITSESVLERAQNLNFARPASLIAGIPARAALALARWQAPPPVPTPPTAANAPPTTPGLPPGATYPTLTADSLLNLPFRSARMQESLERYLKQLPPKYFFVDDTGHFGWANGRRPASQPNEPDDPRERALGRCLGSQDRRCVLFAVDQKLVYGVH